MYPARAKVTTKETVSSVVSLMGGVGGALGVAGGAGVPEWSCGVGGGVTAGADG